MKTRCALLLIMTVILSACGGAVARTPAASAPVAETPAAPSVAAPKAAPPAPAPALVADPPPLRVPLVDDDAWNQQLADILRQEPPAADAARAEWAQIAGAYALIARDFSRAQALQQEQIHAAPTNANLVSDLSVIIGKQGRYAEALEQADRAAAMPGVDAMHNAAVRASWLHHLGRRDDAKAVFAAIPAPAEGDESWALYQGCRACFSASTHDLETLRDSIRHVVALPEHLLFLRRDVIFDQYRREPWFIELVGETAAPQL